MAKIALVQRAPVVLNKYKSIEKVVNIINELGEQSVELAVFPETYLPGFPAWIWRLRPGGDWGISEEVHARRALDVAGHYARPDIFNLTINKNKQRHIDVASDQGMTN